MINEIYEVDQFDFIGFRDQLKKGVYTIKKENNWYNYYSNKTNKLLCAVEKLEDDIKYYIIEMPDKDECRPPLEKTKIELTTKEEVEKFFKILSEAIGGQKK